MEQRQRQRVACMAGMQPEGATRLQAAVCPGFCCHQHHHTPHPCPHAGANCSVSNVILLLAPQVAEGLGLTSITNRDWSIFKTSGAACSLRDSKGCVRCAARNFVLHRGWICDAGQQPWVVCFCERATACWTVLPVPHVAGPRYPSCLPAQPCWWLAT